MTHSLDLSGLSVRLNSVEVSQGRSLDTLYRTGDDWPTFQQRVAQAHEWRLMRDRDAWFVEIQSGLFCDDEWQEEANTDAAGWPLFIYDRWFSRFIIGVALALGLYTSVREAVLYRNLADRYCKRGQWTFDILAAAFWEPNLPSPDEATLHHFWSERQGLSAHAIAQLSAGQIALFAEAQEIAP